MAVLRTGVFWIALLILAPGITAFALDFCLGNSGPWFQQRAGFPFVYYEWSDFGGSPYPKRDWAQIADMVIGFASGVIVAALATYYLCKKQMLPRRISLLGMVVAVLVLGWLLKLNLDKHDIDDAGLFYCYGMPCPLWYNINDDAEQSGLVLIGLMMNISAAGLASVGAGWAIERVMAAIRPGRRRDEKYVNGS
jgi:hypothetical protein